MKIKYLNNAGAGIMSENTIQRVVEHMNLESKVGAYEAANLKMNEVGKFYELSTQLINANDKSEIAYIDSASRGWNLVMYGLNICKDNTIITLSSEYGTNLLTIYDIAKRTGCKINMIQCSEQGEVSLDDIEAALKVNGAILAISHVAAQGSIVNPVEEIGEMAQKYNAIYIVDGCQAVGQMDVDVQKIGCDAYITAGRKWLRGPRGTGILYVKKNAPIRTPQIDLASADLAFDPCGRINDVVIRKDAKQFELWERNVAAVLGLCNAIDEFFEIGIDNISKKIVAKADYLRECISRNSNLALVGSRKSITGVSGFYLKNSDSEEKVKQIFKNGNISISYMCDWDCPVFFPKNGAKYIFRISPHYYTSDDDVRFVGNLIKKL